MQGVLRPQDAGTFSTKNAPTSVDGGRGKLLIQERMFLLVANSVRRDRKNAIDQKGPVRWRRGMAGPIPLQSWHKAYTGDGRTQRVLSLPDCSALFLESPAIPINHRD